jgi:hypothetical protein
MKVYFDDSLEPTDGRTHPYEPSDWATYCDFKKHHELISEVLGDFKPWSRYTATGVFYELIRWLNGPGSSLESNDSAFRGPHPNADEKFAKKMQCDGRLMVFYRTTHLNIAPERTKILKGAIRRYLDELEPDFQWGVLAITSFPVKYLEIPDEARRDGSEVVLTFWAWGDDEEETMENLERLFSALFECLKLVSEDIMAAGL